MENKIDFTPIERNYIANRITGDSIRKLELLPVAIHDLYRAFSMLGLKTDDLENISNKITSVLIELEHLQNIVSFGTTNDDEVNQNLRHLIENMNKEISS
jgi:hypothetical protein